MRMIVIATLITLLSVAPLILVVYDAMEPAPVEQARLSEFSF